MTAMLALCLSLSGVASAAPKKKKKRAAPPPATQTEPAATQAEPAPAKAEPAPAKTEAAAAQAEPAGVEVEPLEVKGKLSKDSRGKLAAHLQGAAAAAKVSGGPYRARLAVSFSGKRDYSLTLTLLGSDGATAATASDACKACSLDEVGTRIDALMEQATAGLVQEEAPPAVASVSVNSTPLGARIRVDGADRGLTPQQLELAPGEHVVIVDKPGFVEREQNITVEAGVDQKLELELTAQPAAAPTGASPGRGLKIGGAVVLGLGLAGVGTGVAMILIDEDPMPLRCSGADVDFRGVCRYRYDTLIGGIVGAGLGAVGVAGGLAMLIKGHQISVRARVGKEQASLGLVWRW